MFGGGTILDPPSSIMMCMFSCCPGLSCQGNLRAHFWLQPRNVDLSQSRFVLGTARTVGKFAKWHNLALVCSKDIPASSFEVHPLQERVHLIRERNNKPEVVEHWQLLLQPIPITMVPVVTRCLAFICRCGSIHSITPFDCSPHLDGESPSHHMQHDDVLGVLTLSQPPQVRCQLTAIHVAPCLNPRLEGCHRTTCVASVRGSRNHPTLSQDVWQPWQRQSWCQPHALPLVAGTAIDDEGREQTQAFFAREALPVISARPDLWPAPWNSVSRFGQVAGVAQSRAFHMEESNWVTGSAKVGVSGWVGGWEGGASGRWQGCTKPVTACERPVALQRRRKDVVAVVFLTHRMRSGRAALHRVCSCETTHPGRYTRSRRYVRRVWSRRPSKYRVCADRVGHDP